jgi:hypothetical protein
MKSHQSVCTSPTATKPQDELERTTDEELQATVACVLQTLPWLAAPCLWFIIACSEVLQLLVLVEVHTLLV